MSDINTIRKHVEDVFGALRVVIENTESICAQLPENRVQEVSDWAEDIGAKFHHLNKRLSAEIRQPLPTIPEMGSIEA